MDQTLTNPASWAQDTFSHSKLGDRRLTKRLVNYAAAQVADPLGSTSRSCRGDLAARLGAYRFIENPRVSPQGIADGMFYQSKSRCADRGRLLIIQDSTSIKTPHKSLYESVRETGGANGFIVHSSLAVDGLSGEILGLVDQFHWLRNNETHHSTRNKRNHTCKESSKWTLAHQRTKKLIGDDYIVVADREADVYEFLTDLVAQKNRFVIRCCSNRRTEKVGLHAHETARKAPLVGKRAIIVEQRGGQPAGGLQVKRQARKRQKIIATVQAGPLTILPPRIRKIEGAQELSMHVVRVSFSPTQSQKTAEPLEWIILTNEPIATHEEVERIVKDYEMRWLIEEFHKAWKTGCRIEERPFQSFRAFSCMMMITASIAVRLLQLRDIAHARTKDCSCAFFLDRSQWSCLWEIAEKKSPPKSPPSAKWACLALARLGGWYDTKKTGRIGWSTIWHGWSLLQEQAIAYQMGRNRGDWEM